MFTNCSLIKKLDLSNFKTNKVKDMYRMFYRCSSLKELFISKFEFNNAMDIECMFGHCSKKIKYKMKNKFKNINKKAYSDYIEYSDNNLNLDYFDYSFFNDDY